MTVDSEPSSPTSSFCYFSIPVAPTPTHFSVETPSTSPLAAYSSEIHPESSHPLLAFRSDYHMPAADASRVLQLQTTAAHRPTPKPLQTNYNNSSRGSSADPSSSGSMSPSTLCCCRCRRESVSGMIQLGTNIYYCSHCARMTGYCAG
ncbi:hypothetical protein CC80DRAFT_191812 [Byssothecium circinans]|uniref:Uncharacterized protein n=1 Tax=Byssothecium circinans TaxID=147558 RepID=A0A6A5TH61_9PLEO|nr:hypothetical protein CC80DRAFT_191812 [Byssothecium circinans]